MACRSCTAECSCTISATGSGITVSGNGSAGTPYSVAIAPSSFQDAFKSLSDTGRSQSENDLLLVRSGSTCTTGYMGVSTKGTGHSYLPPRESISYSRVFTNSGTTVGTDLLLVASLRVDPDVRYRFRSIFEITTSGGTFGPVAFSMDGSGSYVGGGSGGFYTGLFADYRVRCLAGTGGGRGGYAPAQAINHCRVINNEMVTSLSIANPRNVTTIEGQFYITGWNRGVTVNLYVNRIDSSGAEATTYPFGGYFEVEKIG